VFGTSRRAGHIDVLVNNAGITHFGFAEETTAAEAEAVLDTNFLGHVRVTNAVLPGMRARGHGRVINVGSLAAWLGEPGEGCYAASKAALARHTEALRHEVRHRGIAVCVIEPGAFVTPVVDTASTAEATIAHSRSPRSVTGPVAKRAHHSAAPTARGPPASPRLRPHRTPRISLRMNGLATASSRPKITAAPPTARK
jgi:NAD(P)-dependent dehydrogenase (short-subunit alcohol dehydrogenase family)